MCCVFIEIQGKILYFRSVDLVYVFVSVADSKFPEKS